jgi:hypothetical protein
VVPILGIGKTEIAGQFEYVLNGSEVVRQPCSTGNLRTVLLFDSGSIWMISNSIIYYNSTFRFRTFRAIPRCSGDFRGIPIPSARFLGFPRLTVAVSRLAVVFTDERCGNDGINNRRSILQLLGWQTKSGKLCYGNGWSHVFQSYPMHVDFFILPLAGRISLFSQALCTDFQQINYWNRTSPRRGFISCLKSIARRPGSGSPQSVAVMSRVSGGIFLASAIASLSIERL